MNNMFFVLCHPRTGSHLLGSLLRSHPRIDFLSEPFKWTRQRQDFDNIISSSHSDFVGSDIKYGSVDQLIDGIEDKIKGYPVIHLQRLNILRTTISTIIAGTTFPPPLTIDKGVFCEIYNMIKSSSKAITDRYPDCFDLYYEDITAGFWESTDKFQDVRQRKKLLEFIGVNDFELTTGMERDNPGDTRRLINNYQEVLSWVS